MRTTIIALMLLLLTACERAPSPLDGELVKVCMNKMQIHKWQGQYWAYWYRWHIVSGPEICT